MRVPNILPTCFAIALCGLLPNSNAVDFDWNGSADNDWLNAANWTPAGPPSGGAENHALVRNGSASISADVPQVQDWRVGQGAGNTATLQHTAGLGSNVGWTFVGSDGGTGTYNLAGAGGTLGSGSLTTGRIYVGGVREQAPGTGFMTVNTTGTVTATSDLAVSAQGGTGTFTLQAGNVVANSWMIVGETHNGNGGGTGNVIQNGGTMRVGAVDANGPLWLGSQEGTASTVRSTGNYTLNDGALIASEIVVGRHYDGNFTHNGGTVTAGRGTTVGQNAGSIGNYTISGSSTFTQTTPANVEEQNTWNSVGNAGTAVFNLSGSAQASFSSRTHLGLGGTGDGTVNQTGGLFEVRDHELIIADSGKGTYNISSGTLRTMGTRPINVGHWNNSLGLLNVSGTGLVETGGDLNVGNGDNSVGSVAIANGTVTQTGGTVRVGGNLNIGNDVEAIGVYNLNGGTLDLTGGSINDGAGTSTFNFNNGRLEGLGNFNFAEVLQTDGVLAVGPTAGTGISTINGNYSLLLAGDIELSILDTSAFDTLNVNGTVSLLGGLRIVQDTPGLPLNTEFVLVQNDGVEPIVGAFTTLSEGGVFVTSAGNAFAVSYLGGDGNDVEVRVVPEPGTGLLMLGAAGLIGSLRRRRG